MNITNKKIASGVFWNITSIIASRGASTLFMLFLARLLAPEAFGLVAMVTVVFELANTFVNSGLGTAIVRSKNVSMADLNTVFFSNIILSGIVYILISLSAPFVSRFYEQPELTSLIQVMGLVVFINSSKIVQIAVLTRNMNFRSQMKANTLGVIISGVSAVIAALNGWGVWSLVVQMLTSAFVSAIILWCASPWRPKLQFCKASFHRLFKFGANLLIEGAFDVLFQNSYVIVIGRFFSAEVTGLYFFAKKISNIVSQQLTSAVQKATFPALSTLQDNDDELLYKYRQIMQLMMFAISPVMGLIAGLAVPIVSLFGDKWLEAASYLQILCLIGMLYPLHALNMNLLNVKGRSDLVLKVGVVKKFINIILLFFAVPYGVLMIILSQLLGSLLALIPNTYYSSKLINYRVKLQFLDSILPVSFSLFIMELAIFFSSHVDVSVFFKLFFFSFFGGLIYFFLCYFSRVEAMNIIMRKLGVGRKV